MDDITKETIDSLRMRIDELENNLESMKPGRSSLFHKVLDRKKLVAFGAIALALLVCITVAYAGAVSKPYTFSAGTPISAAQINANFDTLYDLVNGNLTGDNIYSVPASAIVGELNTVGSVMGVFSPGASPGVAVFNIPSFNAEDASKGVCHVNVWYESVAGRASCFLGSMALEKNDGVMQIKVTGLCDATGNPFDPSVSPWDNRIVKLSALVVFWR